VELGKAKNYVKILIIKKLEYGIWRINTWNAKHPN